MPSRRYICATCMHSLTLNGESTPLKWRPRNTSPFGGMMIVLLAKYCKSIVSFACFVLTPRGPCADTLFSFQSGFRDAHDYYTQTSSKQYMSRIKIPLLSLHALDDPIVAPYYLPWNEVKQTKHVVFASTNGGGHVGWFKHGENG